MSCCAIVRRSVGRSAGDAARWGGHIIILLKKKSGDVSRRGGAAPGGFYPSARGINLDFCLCTIPTVGLYRKQGEIAATHNWIIKHIYRAAAAALRRLHRCEPPLSSMDPKAAGNAAAASRTVGGRPVNTSGGRGRRPKKPSFGRDARLARDGARLMTGPFRSILGQISPPPPRLLPRWRNRLLPRSKKSMQNPSKPRMSPLNSTRRPPFYRRIWG